MLNYNIDNAVQADWSKRFKATYVNSNTPHKSWPTKVCGPVPSGVEFIVAVALQQSAKPRSRDITAQLTAVAMYLRADGASNGQVMHAMSLAQSKNNVLIDLCEGHNGKGGARLLTATLTGGFYKATLTAKGEKAVAAWLATRGIKVATPTKALPVQPTSDQPAAIEAPANELVPA